MGKALIPKKIREQGVKIENPMGFLKKATNNLQFEYFSFQSNCLRSGYGILNFVELFKAWRPGIESFGVCLEGGDSINFTRRSIETRKFYNLAP